ncbi:hypothetical protein [Fischerella major]|nr:hypothetical protein [Fischerella major]
MSKEKITKLTRELIGMSGDRGFVASDLKATSPRPVGHPSPYQGEG